MATIAKRALECIGTLHGGPQVVRSYPEAASQTFTKGEAVYLDGNGNVAEFTATIDNDSQRFLGFAAEDGHNDTTAATHDCSVFLGGESGNVFEANVTSNGSNQVTAKTQVGNLYPLYMDTTNSLIQVDIDNTAGQIDCANVVEIAGTVGDTNGRVRFTLCGVALQVPRS